MVAARMSLTGSARKTPNTGFGSRCGRMKMSGISKMILEQDGRFVHYESSFYDRNYEETISDVEIGRAHV